MDHHRPAPSPLASDEKSEQSSESTSESDQKSETSTVKLQRTWNKIKLYLKLIVAIILVLVVIGGAGRQLLFPSPANSQSGTDALLQKIQYILENLESDSIKFLPLMEWNGTHPHN